MSAKKQLESLAIDRRNSVKQIIDAIDAKSNSETNTGPQTRTELLNRERQIKPLEEAEKAAAKVKEDRALANAEQKAGKEFPDRSGFFMSKDTYNAIEKQTIERNPETKRPENAAMFAPGRLEDQKAIMDRVNQIKKAEDLKLAQDFVKERDGPSSTAAREFTPKTAHAPKTTKQHTPSKTAESTSGQEKPPQKEKEKVREVKVEDFANNPALAYLASTRAKQPSPDNIHNAPGQKPGAETAATTGIAENNREAKAQASGNLQEVDSKALHDNKPAESADQGGASVSRVHTSLAKGQDLPPLMSQEAIVASAPVRLATAEGTSLSPLNAPASNHASSVDAAINAARSMKEPSATDTSFTANALNNPVRQEITANKDGVTDTYGRAEAQEAKGGAFASQDQTVKDALMQGAHPSEAKKDNDGLGKEAPTATATPRFDQATYGRALASLNENASRDAAAQPAQQAQEQVQQQEQKQQAAQKQQVREQEHVAE